MTPSRSMSSLSGLAACIALALAAPVFALLTWRVPYTPLLSRTLGIPILTVELTVILLAAAAGFRPVGAMLRLSSLTRWAVVVWLSAVLIGTTTASLPALAVTHAASTIIHGVFALAIWDRLSSEWNEVRLPMLTAVACGVIAYIAVVHLLALSVWEEPGFRWDRFGPGVSNVRQLGFYGLTLGGLSLGMLAFRPHPQTCWPLMLLLVAGYYMVDWSGGRASFAASIASSFIVIWLTPKNRRGPLAGAALTCFLVAMPLSMILVPDSLWGIGSIFRRAIPAEGVSGYTSGRLEMWVQTIAALREHLWFGHGQGQWRFQVPAALGLYNHPHNSLLQFAYDWGLVGLGALAAAFIPFVQSLFRKDGPDLRAALPALGAFSGLALMSLVDGSLYYAYPIMVSLICIAVTATAPRRDSDPFPENEKFLVPEPVISIR